MLKRLVPNDAAKIVPNGVEISVINVITPLPVSEIPQDPVTFLTIELGGVALTTEEKQSIMVTVDNESLPLARLREYSTIAVGAKMVFNFPTTKFKVGDEISVRIQVPLVNVDLSFSRTLQ